MACDVSWKSKLSIINDANVLLKTQVDFVVKERENIKLEYQKLFNSIKATWTQHQKDLDEVIEHVNQKTYAYADVRAQNQDLFITIFELKNKLQTVDKGKIVNTKFDKSETSRTLLCVTPLPKNIECVESSNSVRRQKSKATKSKDRVLKSKTDKDHMHMFGRCQVIQIVLWIVNSGCSKHMTGNLQLLRNFVEKFLRTIRFGNDHFAAIIGYRDYVQGNLTLCHVYYLEGLGHSLFSVRKFCDGDLEAAFHLNTCYVLNLEGDDFLIGSRDSNLYTISIFEMVASSQVCLMSRATSTKSWLWHHRLSHLNFGTINQLTSNNLVDGLLKFKYNKDHLCSAYEQGKSKKASFLPKLVPSMLIPIE
ncbi:integrase, catalytic region, zinc finger, CCHC-type containing protein [Tanacetum coccineum]